MNPLFFTQDQINTIFASPAHADDYNGYFTSLHNLDSSCLLNDFSSCTDNMSNKFTDNNANFYPSPSHSPLSSEIMIVTTPELHQPQSQAYHHQQHYVDPIMMIPPLPQFESFDVPMDDSFTHHPHSMLTMPESYEDKSSLSIELVDQFIAQHHAALLYNQQNQQVPVKETSWSYYTYSRGSTPEVLSETSSVSSLDPVAITTSPAGTCISDNNEKTIRGKSIGNKELEIQQEHQPPATAAYKKTRRGRGKGVKNSTTNKKAIVAAAAAAMKAKSVASGIDNNNNNRESTEGTSGALYVCQHNDCGRSFTRPYNLTSHMRTHTSDRPYSCSNCGRRFARQHDRNRHEKLHWGIRPYACHHCHKSFARMDALNRHLRMENGCTGSHL